MKHKLTELLAEVAEENQRLQPRPLVERMLLALATAPLLPGELADRLGADDSEVAAAIATHPFDFVVLGAQVGAVEAALARVRVGATAPPENASNAYDASASNTP